MEAQRQVKALCHYIGLCNNCTGACSASRCVCRRLDHGCTPGRCKCKPSKCSRQKEEPAVNIE